MKQDFHSRSVASRFSAAAKTYDRSAGVQRGVALKLMRYLADIRNPASIIEIGCGTGLLTQLIADRYPEAAIQGIDVARNLVDVAAGRLRGNRNVTFHVANAMNFRPAAPVPLVASTSTFHWIMPLQGLFRNVAAMLRPDGHLVFSMMIKGTLLELHESRKRIAHDNRVQTPLPDADQVVEALTGAGFSMTERDEEAVQIEYPSATDMLYSLHNLGVTGGGISSSGRPLSRMEVAELLADYAEYYRSKSGGVFATYRVLYISAIPRGRA